MFNYLPGNPKKWEAIHLSYYFNAKGFARLASVFKENLIDAKLLCESINDEDLKDLGLSPEDIRVLSLELSILGLRIAPTINPKPMPMPMPDPAQQRTFDPLSVMPAAASCQNCVGWPRNFPAKIELSNFQRRYGIYINCEKNYITLCCNVCRREKGYTIS